MKTRLISFTFAGFSFCYSASSFSPDNAHPSAVKDRIGRIPLVFAVIAFALSLSGTVAARPRSEPADSLVVRAITLVDSGYTCWDKDAMLQGYAILQRAETISPDDRFVDYYLSYAAYRLMTYGMTAKDERLYGVFARQAETRATKLETRYGDWAEPKILLASIYGIEIAHNWTKGMTLGAKSTGLAEKAVALDPSDPRCYLVLGCNKLNTPAIFGGSVTSAIGYLAKADSLFQVESASKRGRLAPSWGRIDALTWLGLAYDKEKRYGDALAAYREALRVDPDYSRAKQVLIPDIEMKLESAISR